MFLSVINIIFRSIKSIKSYLNNPRIIYFFILKNILAIHEFFFILKNYDQNPLAQLHVLTIFIYSYIYIYIIFIGSSTCTPSNYLKKSMAVCRWSTFGRKGEPSD